MKWKHLAVVLSLCLIVSTSVQPKAVESQENTIGNRAVEIAQEQSRLLPKMDALKADLTNTSPDTFGGIYFEGDKPVVLISGDYNSSKSLSAKAINVSNDAIVKYVKYSEKELDNTVDEMKHLFGISDTERSYPKINGRQVDASWGVDTAANKVVFYTDDEEVKSFVLKHFDQDIVYFTGALGPINEQSSYASPGTLINQNGGNCTIAFTGKINSDNVAVTAGHCSN